MCSLPAVKAGAWLYALFLVGTALWALVDVGLVFWPLFSRLFMFGVIGMVVALVYPLLARANGASAGAVPTALPR